MYLEGFFYKSLENEINCVKFQPIHFLQNQIKYFVFVCGLRGWAVRLLVMGGMDRILLVGNNISLLYYIKQEPLSEWL